jgi:hypothetical protein
MRTLADSVLEYDRAVNPSLPLINVGSTGKPVYVLAELCKIVPGQPARKKLGGREQDAMIQFACRPPPANAKSVSTAGRELLGLDNNPLLVSRIVSSIPRTSTSAHTVEQAAFGLSVDRQLVTVRGRELPPPVVVYLKGNSAEPVVPEHGSWLMKSVRVAKAGLPIRNWTYMYITLPGRKVDPNGVKVAMEKFGGFMAQSMGINISPRPTPPSGATVQFQGHELAMKQKFGTLMAAKPPPQLVFVVLPEKSTELYNIIKKSADVEFGVHTVCVVQDKFLQERGQLGYFANVALKVNLKFGGVNHKLRDEIGLIKPGNTMVAGYDVTHPTNLPTNAKRDQLPSMVGLVASVDKDLGQWPSVSWNNPGGQESLGPELVDNFKSRLVLWRQKNAGRLPENIVIFRDGVSEGQFNMVLDKELPSIREACKLLYQGNKMPRISLIVSVKRHQTRFYPSDPKHIHPRSKSPKEGTVVDRGITNARYWDFFLQAHASLQGKSVLPLFPVCCRGVLTVPLYGVYSG